MKNNSEPSFTVEQLESIYAGLGNLMWAIIVFFFTSLASVGTWKVFIILPFILSMIGIVKIRSAITGILAATPEYKKKQRMQKEQAWQEPAPMLTREPIQAVKYAEETIEEKPLEKIVAAKAQNGFGSFAIKNIQEKNENSQEESRETKESEKENKPFFLETVDWEKWIGQKLLQKVGILIVLIGMIVFLKFSFDNGYIGILGRIAMSTLAGIGLLFVGEYFSRKFALWSHAFTGAGIALLYFTVWAASVFYHDALLIQHGISVSPVMAMVLYSIITAIGALAAIRYSAQTIAWFTLLGGYLTPLLIGSEEASFISLAIYLAILAGGMLALAWHQKWTYIALASFALTQLYLWSIYSAVTISDFQQIGIAIGFFILFALPPLLYQFKLQRSAEFDDIALILADGIFTFLAVINALGGFGGQYVGLVSLILAAIYIAFAALALQQRSDDRTLVNTYLLSGIGLVALALFAQMEMEWVAAGWAPYSVLLLLIAKTLRQKSVFFCAVALLTGSLITTILNIPILQPDSGIVWHPFTSHWALLGYVVFASLLAWLRLCISLPKELELPEDSSETISNMIHIIIAGYLFTDVTFEATKLQLDFSLTLAYSYLGYITLAIILFAYTEKIIWFLAAFFVQILILLCTFLLVDASGMISPFLQGMQVIPFIHPWSGVSCLSLITLFSLLKTVKSKPRHDIHLLPIQNIITAIILGQIWLHITVEIEHMYAAYSWTRMLFERVLSAWWILFSLPLFWHGVRKQKEQLVKIAITALLLPYFKDLFLMLTHQTNFYELFLWTAISITLMMTLLRVKQVVLQPIGFMMILGVMMGDVLPAILSDKFDTFAIVWWTFIPLILVGFALRKKDQHVLMLPVGLLMIVGTMMGDVSHAVAARETSLFTTLWWTAIPLILITAALREKERSLMLPISLLMIVGTMMGDIASSSSVVFTTAWWTFIAFILIGISIQKKEPLLIKIGLGMIVLTILYENAQTAANTAGVLHTIWWTIVATVIMGIGFLKNEKVLRQFAICVFGAALVKLLVIDFNALSTGVRILASILTGFMMIGASYLYQKFDALLKKAA